MAASLHSGTSSRGSCEVASGPEFPSGLRVLVVDDDPTTLKIVERMSILCGYRVTTCSEAAVALNLLRERKGDFDVVLSDVHMPGMDGYKLLEHVGLEMDLPVIMMSVDGRTSAVMKGIRHGACDYLIKPVRLEELKNIWQHVVRKIRNENKEPAISVSMEHNETNEWGRNDAAHTSSVDATEGMGKVPKRRTSSKEVVEMETDDPAFKKPRVVWSIELHQKFVNAVNHIGFDKAVPKSILEVMNVPNLTRENVASHLQKYRIYLKRLKGVVQEQIGVLNTVPGTIESMLSASARFDIQALASGLVPPETLAALHAEFFDYPITNIMPTVDQTTLLQASRQGPKHSHVDHGLAHGQPLEKCPSNIAQNFPQPIVTFGDTSSGYVASQSSNAINLVGPNSSVGRLGVQNNDMLMNILQHQQQQQMQQQHQQQQHPQQPSLLIQDQSRSINVQPSRLVVHPQASDSSKVVNNLATVNQGCSFGRNVMIDYGSLSQKSNNSSSTSQFPGGDAKAKGVFRGYTRPSFSPQTFSSPIGSTNSNIPQLQNSTFTFGAAKPIPGLLPVTDRQVPYGVKSGASLDQVCPRSLGFVGRGTNIPSRFVENEIESSASDFSQMKVSVDSNGNTMKEELNIK